MALPLVSKLPASPVLRSQRSITARFSSISTQNYDIVISGGGMVGFAMACSLGKQKSITTVMLSH